MKPLNAEKLNQTLNDWLASHIDEADTAGGEILVTQCGECLCHIVKGVADVRTGRLLEPNALYRLASMTKPITGLAALIAVQKGWFSLEDYAKIAQLLCNGGSLNGVRLVKPDLFAELAKPRVADNIPGRSPNDSWGLGVRVKVHEDWLPIGVFGWSGAYGTHFWVDPDNQITAILMRNMRWHDTHGAGGMGVEFERLVMQCA